MDSKQQQLNKALAPVVEGMGFEYVGCEFIPQGKHSLLRVYIDKQGGIKLGECAEVSHQLSGVLDVEDLIKSRYSLEVSSPGLDRPLFTMAQFCKAIGKQVKLRLSMPLNERRQFGGELKSVLDENIVLICEGEEVVIPFALIAKAKVIYQFD